MQAPLPIPPQPKTLLPEQLSTLEEVIYAAIARFEHDSRATVLGVSTQLIPGSTIDGTAITRKKITIQFQAESVWTKMGYDGDGHRTSE